MKSLNYLLVLLSIFCIVTSSMIETTNKAAESYRYCWYPCYCQWWGGPSRPQICWCWYPCWCWKYDIFFGSSNTGTLRPSATTHAPGASSPDSNAPSTRPSL